MHFSISIYLIYAKMHVLYTKHKKYLSLIQIIFLWPKEPKASFMSTNKAVIIRINKSLVVLNMKVTIKQLMNRYEEDSIIARQITLRRQSTLPKGNEIY